MMDSLRKFGTEDALQGRSHVTKLLLLWYIGFFVVMSIAPFDRTIWLTANVLPVLFVGTLVLTHRVFTLSNLSYLLITAWLTMHTVAVHYTYPKVPLGFWIQQWFDLHRNHFDRIVHFSFGLCLTYPIHEIFGRVSPLKDWHLRYHVVMTILGISAVWEIIEAWIGQIAHPDLEMAFVGHQGDVWDAQRDMAAAVYGSVLCLLVLLLARAVRERSTVLEPTSVAPSSVHDLSGDL